jgi:hypothetical protein
MEEHKILYMTASFFIGVVFGAALLIGIIAYSAHLDWKKNKKNKV